jgi:hypothetical protein
VRVACRNRSRYGHKEFRRHDLTRAVPFERRARRSDTELLG